MFESLITQVLNKVLGNFIENIDSDQLNISIMKGDVILTNMKLKQSLFDALPLPFALKFGKLGKLSLKIPVWNMFNQPLIIEITDLFALVTPRHLQDWKDEVEIKAYQSANQSTLEQYEVFSQSAESLTSKDPSSIEKLIAKIVDNIQIKISNIYIRYEDAYSAPTHGSGKFVMGLLLKEFSTFTTGSDWKNVAMQLGEEITHKLATIKDFSLFLDYETSGEIASSLPRELDIESLMNDKNGTAFIDILKQEFENHSNHHYIIEKFGMQARIKYNKAPIANKLPQLELELLFGGRLSQGDEDICVKLNVHQPQIIRILKLLEYVGYYNQFQSGALTKFKRRTIMKDLADEYIQRYCEWRIASDVKKPQKDLVSSLRLQLKAIEDEYPSEKIIVLRKFGSKVVQQRSAQSQNEEQISKKVQEMSKDKIGWGIFISKERKEKEQKAIEEFKQKLQEDLKNQVMQEKSSLDSEMQALTDSLSQTQVLASNEDFNKMAKGYLRFRFRLKIPSVQLSFINEFKQCLFISEVVQQNASVDIGKGFTKAEFTVFSLKIKDCWSVSSAFPDILDTKELSEIKTVNSQAFIFIFESNDDMVISPFHVEIKTEKTLFLVGNIPFINEIKRSTLKALQGEQLDFSFYRSAATESALQYMTTGKEFIESIKNGEYQHKSLDILLYFTAPIIIVPENIFRPEAPILIIDTGSISLQSYLVGYTQGIDYKVLTSPENLFDRYVARLSNFQINILDKGLPNGLKDFKRGQGTPAIKEFSTELSFFNCVEPFHPVHSTAEIDIVIKSFEIQVARNYIRTLLRIVNSLQQQLDESDFQYFQKVLTSSSGQPRRMASRVSNQLKKQIKNQVDDNQQEEAKIKAGQKISQQNQNEDDEFVEMLDEEKYLEKFTKLEKQKSIQLASKEREGKPNTSLKVYFSVEKFQVNLLEQAIVQEQHQASENFMQLILMHLEVEAEIDRLGCKNIKMSIFKFDIEDSHNLDVIAQPFRLIFSSPSTSSIVNLSPDEFLKLYKQGVCQKSLLKKIPLPTQTSQKQFTRFLTTRKNVEDEDSDEFKDALSDEEAIEEFIKSEEKQKEAPQVIDQPNQITVTESKIEFQNQFDLKLFLSANGDRLDLDCVLNDIRFVFAVPTAQNLALVGLKLQDVLSKAENQKSEARKNILATYHTVFTSQGYPTDSQEEISVLDKIFTNISVMNGFEKTQAFINFDQSLKRLQRKIKVPDVTKSEQKPVEISIPENKSVKQAQSKISIRARLNNFQIWVPLKADNLRSQIFNFSFMSQFVFIKEVNSSKLFLSTDQITFNISKLQISMINLVDNAIEANVQHLTVSNILDPCAIVLNLENQVTIDENKSQKLDITIEPLYLRIGFKHVDFANIVMSEVNQTLEYVKSVQQDKDGEEQHEENKEFFLNQQLSREKKSPLKRAPGVSLKFQSKPFASSSYANEIVETQLENNEDFIDDQNQSDFFDQNDFQKEIEEEAVEEFKTLSEELTLEEQIQSSFKFKKYNSQAKYPVSISQIKLICDSLTLSLSDDTMQGEDDRPLFLSKLSNLQLSMKVRDQEDDAGAFILKKMGIWKLLYPKDYLNKMHQEIQFFADLHMNYYNHRTLAYEPLMEPWYAQISVSQFTRYSEKEIILNSQKMLNVNLTFGMALTIKKIKDRVLESLKQAQILAKIEKKELITPEEELGNQVWRRNLINTKNPQPSTIGVFSPTVIMSDALPGNPIKAAFIFQNFTGVDIAFIVHNESEGNISGYGVSQTSKFGQHVMNLPGNDSSKQVYKTQQELFGQRQQNISIIESSMDGQVALSIDLSVAGLETILSVPIEGLGIFSYRAHLQNESILRINPQYGKKSEQDQRASIIVNIRLQGSMKIVSFESNLLIANNNEQNELNLILKNNNQDDNQVRSDQMTKVQPKSVFRVPLTWIYTEVPSSLYIKIPYGKQILFKNMHEIFADKLQDSKLNQQSSKILELSPQVHTSMDIFAYQCLPLSHDPNLLPAQYLVSFNKPLMISNYNFSSLELYSGKNALAKVAPKETAYVNCLNMELLKPNLDWLVYDSTLKDRLVLQTQSFDLMKRVQNKEKSESENFIFSKGTTKKSVKLVMETKRVMQQYVIGYTEIFSAENFELRDRLADFTISCQIMLYPKYMFVNKTTFNISIEKQDFLALQNDYLNTSRDLIQIKVAGYKKQEIDITTIGLSGAITMDIDNISDVQQEKLQQKEYIPQKLEFGLMISPAPTPFNKTTVLTLVPRYVIVNQLGSPIVLMQRSTDKRQINKQILVRDKIYAYNFQEKKERFLMIREITKNEDEMVLRGKNLFPDYALEDKFWSSPFSLDELEDFQVCFPGHEVHHESHNARPWYLPSYQNGNSRFVRVIVTTQNDASILVVLTNPQVPEYEIQNKSKAKLHYAQMQEDSIVSGLTSTFSKNEDLIIGSFKEIHQDQMVPFAWTYRLNQTRNLAIKLGTQMHKISVDNDASSEEYSSSEGQKFIIEIQVTGNSKKVVISEVSKIKNGSYQKKGDNGDRKDVALQRIFKRSLGSVMNTKIDIRGLSISFVDEKPQEIILLTLYDIKLRFTKWYEPRYDRLGVFENGTKIKFQMEHMQLDNMTSNTMPVILAPIKPLMNKKDLQIATILGEKGVDSFKMRIPEEESKKIKVEEQEVAPFFQVVINLVESQQFGDKVPVKRLRGLQVAIQEFNFQCESSIIQTNLKIALELLQTFTDEQMLLGLGNIQTSQQAFETAKLLDIDQICDFLKASSPLVEESQEIHAKKMFIEYVHLNAIKCNITFILEKKAVELDVSDPAHGFGAVGLVYTIMSGVASISNSPLYFKELILLNVFASQEALVSQITKNYVKQAVFQFYKLLGSSDIIGNPVGLVDKLGTGVFELISEPSKGLLKGPDEFIGGIGKGVQSLVGNVISGGFESISKITGSLYSVVKNVSGEKNVQLQKSRHIGQGFVHGVTGGVSELVGGVTGIFTKPFEKTKEEGAKGFLKGLGSGLFGAITAPVTATLRAGSSLTQGVAGTATMIKNIGKETNEVDFNSIYSRFRPPRYFNARNVLTDYNFDLAIVKQILSQAYNGKYATNQTIRYFTRLQQTNYQGELQNKDPNSSIFIITDKMILYLRISTDGPKLGKTHSLFKAKLNKVKRCELQQVGNPRLGILYILMINTYSQMKGSQEYRFQTTDYSKFEKIYQYLSFIPHCQTKNEVKPIAKKQISSSLILQQMK